MCKLENIPALHITKYGVYFKYKEQRGNEKC
jgi:hypothetical protein